MSLISLLVVGESGQDNEPGLGPYVRQLKWNHHLQKGFCLKSMLPFIAPSITNINFKIYEGQILGTYVSGPVLRSRVIKCIEKVRDEPSMREEPQVKLTTTSNDIILIGQP